MKGKTDIYSIKLAVNQSPKLTIDLSKNIVKYGPKNDFPDYLLFLYKNHPMHGGIINGKSRYLSGNGIKAKQSTPNTELFLKYANPLESWYQLKKKLDKDKVISGGYFLKVITNALGQPLQYHHLSFAKCRISPCKKYVHHSEDWKQLQMYPVTIFPVFTSGMVGTSVFVYKNYTPSKTGLEETYAEPEYLSCLIDIDTDIRIGSFGNSLVKNNFSAGNVITVKNGETDRAKQKAISDSLKFNFEGEENAGKSVVIFGTKDTPSTDIQSINTTDQDKQYVEVNKRDQQNILTAHNVNGILFKIKTEGQLGGRSELVEAHELFINEYVKVEQESELETLKMFYKLRFGQEAEFEIEQISPIGLELPLDNQNVIDAINKVDSNLIFKYLVDKYNIQVEQTNSDGTPIIKSEINDGLRGLAGKENIDLKRIVREYNSQAITLTQAILRLVSGFGMTEQQAKDYLGANDNVPGPEPVQQSSHDKSNVFFTLFEKYAHDINFEDEVLDVQEVKLGNIVRFNKELNNSVLEQIKGNPSVKEDEIAKATNSSLDEVKKAIEELIVLGLIAKGLKSFEITEKALNKDTAQSEVYTEYVYAKRSDVSGDTLLSTSRPFCVDLVNLTKRKALTYEAINTLQNEFGENVWDFRGGFYTKKGTNDTTPWCRHVWSAVTKIRRKK